MLEYVVFVVLILGLIDLVVDLLKNADRLASLPSLISALLLMFSVLLPDGRLFTYSLNPFFKLASLAVGISLLIIVLSGELIKTERPGLYNGLLILTALGAVLASAADDFISMLVAWQLSTLSSYVLVSIKKDAFGAEAGMKYLVVGLASFGALIFGVGLIAGSTGSLNYVSISQAITGDPVTLLGVVLLIAALGYKMAAFPFFVWMPDTYQGAPPIVGGVLSAITKTMAFMVAFKIFLVALLPIKVLWVPVIAAVSALTMIYGNIAALVQENARRMLAYSSIAHAGYILMALAALSSSSLVGGLSHVFVHAVMKVVAFATVMQVLMITGSDYFKDFAGLRRRAPLTLFSMAVSFMAMIGIPLTAGFWTKYVLFLGAVGGGVWWLTAIAVICSVISIWYYIKPLRWSFVEGGGLTAERKPSRAAQAGMLLGTAVIILLGFVPSPLLTLAKAAVLSIMP